MQGKTINGFILQRLLGTGGMAEVWYAESKIGMKAAVKILSEKLSHDDQMQERFLNEAKVMVQLDHPNIRKVYGFDEIDGRPAIVMEYLDGSDLKARMKRGQRFTQEELVKWWNQLVDALNYTHAQNIVHRDIKPSNIFIDQKSNAKLLDFGIAKVADTTTGTQTGSTLGTRIYMSPEQVRDPKRVGPPSDVYSLAVSFVHLLTGKAPYDSSTNSDYDIQESIVRKPVDISKVPTGWQGFLAPYLAKRPEERPALRPFEAVASEVPDKTDESDDEGTIVGDAPKKQEPPRQEPKKPEPKPETKPNSNKPKNKKGLWIGWLGIAAAVVVAIVTFLFSKDKSEESHVSVWEQVGAPPLDSYVIETPETTSTDAPAEGIDDDFTITANGVSFVMKRVSGGTFQMGSDDSEAYSDEKPVHSVTVSSFYMGETEVTQALWKAVMGSNPSNWKGDNLPVESVSWNDCQEFIRKLNSLTGRSFRLPTEAEWEYVARGGSRSSGTKYAGSSSIGSVAWYTDNSGSKTHSVKGKSPNELGLYDMSGNVWEWCGDWYGGYDSGSQTNPKGPSSGSYRVLRGGSWDNYARICRVSYRSYGVPDYRRGNLGFRLCLPQ